MHEGLFTGPSAKWPETVLPESIFSGPVACVGLVNLSEGIEKMGKRVRPELLSILVSSVQMVLGSNNVRTEPPKALMALVFLLNER